MAWLASAPPPGPHVQFPPAGTPDRKPGNHEIVVSISKGHDDECGLTWPYHSMYASFVRWSSAARIQRLLEVARRFARTSIPGVEEMHAMQCEGERGYFETGVVRGRSVADLVRAGVRLSAPLALAIAYETCAALDRLRAVGFVHGGVTPARIRITPSPSVVVCLGMLDEAPPDVDVRPAAASYALELATPDPMIDALRDRVARCDPTAREELATRIADAELATLASLVS